MLLARLPLAQRRAGRRGGRRRRCWAWCTHSTGSSCHSGYVPEPAGDPRSGRRRRLTAVGASLLLAAVPLLAAALLVGGAAPASATGQAAPAPATPAATSAKAPAAATGLCQLVDPRLPELSGLVGAGGQAARHERRRQTDWSSTSWTPACQVVDVRTAAIDPYDPEDLAARLATARIWLADIGDNRAIADDGGAAGPAPGRLDQRLPADLPRRRARRRGAAARAGRDALPGDQGDPGRERRLPAGAAPWSTAAHRRPGQGRRRCGPDPHRHARADRSGRRGQLLVTGGAVVARRAAGSRCAPTPTPTCGR